MNINETIINLTKQEKNILVDIYGKPNGRAIVGGKVPLHLQSVIEKMLVYKHVRTYKLTSLGKMVAKQLTN